MNVYSMGDFNPPPAVCQARGPFGFFVENVIDYSGIEITGIPVRMALSGPLSGKPPGSKDGSEENDGGRR